MQHKRKFILLTALSMFFAANIHQYVAAEEPVLSTDVIKTEQIELSSNKVFKQNYSNAVSKFENLNIKVAHDDFYKLIMQQKNQDFYLLLLANKTAELGFFDLSNLAFSKITDIDISNTTIENTKKFYYPSKPMTQADTIILAELYSNIIYNDQAKETIKELQSYPGLLSDYDYANYIMALGYHKLKDNKTAAGYIRQAIKTNSSNINYKLLEAQILADTKKGKLSKKILKEINLQNLDSCLLTDKINSANQYVMYLSARNSFDKDYYLGRYYFSKKDYVKSARIFQSAVTKNKKNNAILYGMMSRCYFEQGDYSKASEFAQKSIKLSKNTDSFMTLGDIEAKNGNFKSAIKYYKETVSNHETRLEGLEKIASAYTKLSNKKRADDIYKQIRKEYNNSYLAYYNSDLSGNEIGNIKKAISININFIDGWIDMARIMIDNGNFELAQNYLAVANYLDDNNFRYYYYQSLLKKKESELHKNNSDRINKVANEIQYLNSRGS